MRHWRVALAGAGLVLLLGACLLLLPTLQNKIVVTRSDAEQFDTVGAANYYSVTARVYSYDVAWALVKQRPLLGLSKIELEAAMARQYRAMYPGIEPAHYLLPHNQFLYNLAAYGAVGLLVFAVGFTTRCGKASGSVTLLLLLMYSDCVALLHGRVHAGNADWGADWPVFCPAGRGTRRAGRCPAGPRAQLSTPGGALPPRPHQ
ncbi:MAG: O-antigen ligase family protein [Hymenobacter sp.]